MRPQFYIFQSCQRSCDLTHLYVEPTFYIRKRKRNYYLGREHDSNKIQQTVQRDLGTRSFTFTFKLHITSLQAGQSNQHICGQWKDFLELSSDDESNLQIPKIADSKETAAKIEKLFLRSIKLYKQFILCIVIKQCKHLLVFVKLCKYLRCGYVHLNFHHIVYRKYLSRAEFQFSHQR